MLLLVVSSSVLAQGPGWLDDSDVEPTAAQNNVRREPQPIRTGGFVQQLRSLSDGIFKSKEPQNGSQKSVRPNVPPNAQQNPWSRAAERARQNPEQVQRFSDSISPEINSRRAPTPPEDGRLLPPQPSGTYLLDSQARSRPWTPQTPSPLEAPRTTDEQVQITSGEDESKRTDVRGSGAASRFQAASQPKKPAADSNREPSSSLEPPEVRISEFNSKKQARASSKNSQKNLHSNIDSESVSLPRPTGSLSVPEGKVQAPKVARKSPPKRDSAVAQDSADKSTVQTRDPSRSPTNREPVIPQPSQPQTKPVAIPNVSQSLPSLAPGNGTASSFSNNSSSSLSLPPTTGNERRSSETVRPETPSLNAVPTIPASPRVTGAIVGSMLPSLISQTPPAPGPASSSSAGQETLKPQVSRESNSATSNQLRNSNPSTPVQSGVHPPRGLLNMEIPHITVQMLGPSDLQIGMPADYQIVVHNQDRIGVSGVLLSLDVPASVNIERLPSNQGEVRLEKSDDNSNVLTWILPEMPANVLAKLPIRMTARDARNFAVAMEWTVVPQAGNKQIEVRQAQLRLALEGPSEVEYGVPHVYRLRLSNPGNAPAKNVVVNLNSNSNGSSSSEIGDVGPGQEQVVDVELTFQQRGAVKIAAEASSGPNLRTQSNIEVQVRQAALSAALVTSPVALFGAPTPCEAKITNAGDAEAKNVKASIMLPSGCTFTSAPPGATVKGNELVWSLPRLAAGDTATYQFQFSSSKPGTQSMLLACVASGSIQARSEANFEVEAVADLKLVVNDPPAPAAVNSEVVYELTVTNRGSRDASSVKVLAQFSDGIEPIRADGAKHRIVPGQVLFEPIDNIQPGQTLHMKVIAKATQDGTHRFRAEVRCDENETRLVHELSTRFRDSVRRMAAPPNSTMYR